MKISIITVCYNAVSTIAETLASIASQRNVQVEPIVIDGGSRDGTQNVVDRFRSSIAYFVSEPDRGIYHAMNKGFAAATGDFIGFLNADDAYVSDDILREVSDVATATDATVVAGSITQVDAAGREVRSIPSHGFHSRQLRYGMFPPHPATFVRSDIARAVGEFDEQFRVGADFDYFLRLHNHGSYKLATINRNLVKMRRGGASTSGLRSYINISHDMIGALRKQNPSTPALPIYLRAIAKLAQFKTTAKFDGRQEKSLAHGGE